MDFDGLLRAIGIGEHDFRSPLPDVEKPDRLSHAQAVPEATKSLIVMMANWPVTGSLRTLAWMAIFVQSPDPDAINSRSWLGRNCTSGKSTLICAPYIEVSVN